jgi:peptidoglycan hydrolase-like protein with peptidoglycan-binding domain
MKRKYISIALCLVFTFSVVSIAFSMQQSVIMDYQKKLKTLGYYSGEYHGKLDEATIAAIKACQKACAMKETGKLDKGTCKVIDKALKEKEAKEKAK